jgi:hypothetical protein
VRFVFQSIKDSTPSSTISHPHPPGKSRLLAALCLLVARVAELAEAQHEQEDDNPYAAGYLAGEQQHHHLPPLRVLVAASTNVAVDRVLTLLHEFGCVLAACPLHVPDTPL